MRSDFIDQESVQAIRWQDGRLALLDQRVLPAREHYLEYDDAEEVAAAISDMVVRGAPAIGITAAYGVVLAVQKRYAEDPLHWRDKLDTDLRVLAASRPTAVNLFWAIERMRGLLDGCGGIDPQPLAESEALAIHAQDLAANRRMGELGQALIAGPACVLTHCNTGALATGGVGTALGVIRAAWRAGKLERVYADETRPWLQGSRLTAWELVKEKIPTTILCEGAAASLMRSGRVSWVIVGADRIAANGDVANKIGTYSLAVLARQHGVRFMVVAPTTTCDRATADGGAIPIELRAEAEVLEFAGQRHAPREVHAWNPAFDVTPAELVDAIVTEAGVIERPDAAAMARLFERSETTAADSR